MNICFTDKAISDVRHSKLEFIFKPFIDIPFKNIKHTRLKGLKLRVFRNGEIYFVLQYWFEGKPKKITLGEYMPGVLKAIKKIGSFKSLVYGLEKLIF